MLAYWREHREQLRQSENQRAVLTNYVLVIAAAISGFIVQQHFELRTLPLSVLTVAIGLYGAVAVAKYHERADYHLSQARALTRVLVDAGALANHDVVLEEFHQQHYRKYPRLPRRSSAPPRVWPMRASCTDSTARRSHASRRPGIIRPAGPRPVPHRSSCPVTGCDASAFTRALSGWRQDRKILVYHRER